MTSNTHSSAVPMHQELPICVRSAVAGSFQWRRVGSAVRTETGFVVRFLPAWEAVARVLWDARGSNGSRLGARVDGLVWGLRLEHGEIVTVGYTAPGGTVLRALPANCRPMRRTAGMSIGREGPRAVRAWRPAA